MNNVPSLQLLIVEDDPATRDNLVDILKFDGHCVETAGTAAEALTPRGWDKLDGVILDWRLPDGTAETLFSRLAELAPRAAVIIVTGQADIERMLIALRRGARDYLLKPVDADTLRASLRRLAEGKQLAQARAESEAAFRTLVEAAECLILILDPDGTITYLNPYSERITGYHTDEVVGRRYREVFPDDELLSPPAYRTDCVEAGPAAPGYESPIYCRDGSQRWILWSIRPLSGEPDGRILMVGQDVTERRQVERRLLESERLTAIGEMVTGLAHESRNALQRSQASLELLALELANCPKALRLLASVQRAQDHLHRLYEEVREYAAPIYLRKQVFHLPALLHTAWDQLDVLRRTKAVRLEEENPSGADLNCLVDGDALGQVLRHVLENAIAACPEPGKIVAVYRASELDGRPALDLLIRDNGPGISPKQQARVFEPFYTTKMQGTGLGMAVAKRIVEAHGGRIHIENAASGGAEVRITLPRPAGGCHHKDLASSPAC